MQKKSFKRKLVLFFIILLIGFFLKKNWQWAYEIKPSWEAKVNIDLEDLGILDGGTLVTWDGDVLAFYDKKGKVDHEVDRTAEGQEAYIGHSRVALYDGDLKKVTVFNSRGEETVSYSVEGEVFSVEEQNGNILIFTKQDRGEILYMGDQSGGLEALFQTDHFILDYCVWDSNKYTVAELSNEASGYKTNLYWKEGDLKKEEFPNQVAMEVGYYGDSVLMATEKTLFSVNKDKVLEVEIPLISDIYFNKSGIYLLHSGILSKYNKKLEKVDQGVMTANVNRLDEVKGSLVATGNGELVGNLMGSREFHVQMDRNLKLLKVKDGYMVTYGKEGLRAYDFHRKIFSSHEGPIVLKEKEEKKD